MSIYDSAHFRKVFGEAQDFESWVTTFLRGKLNRNLYNIVRGRFPKRPVITIDGVTHLALDGIEISKFKTINGQLVMDVESSMFFDIKYKDEWFPYGGDWTSGFDDETFREYDKLPDAILNNLHFAFWHAREIPIYTGSDLPYPGPGLWMVSFNTLKKSHYYLSTNGIRLWNEKIMTKLCGPKEFTYTVTELTRG